MLSNGDVYYSFMTSQTILHYRIPLISSVVVGVLIAGSVFFYSLQHSSNLTNAPQADDQLTVELIIHDSNPKSLRIENDGTVTFTKNTGIQQAVASSDDLTALKQGVLQSDFFSLDESYKGAECCDFIGHTITITIGEATKTVYCYTDCPAPFDQSKEKIIDLWPSAIPYDGFA